MKQISEHASAAREIRKELKTAFPGIKFSVTSESYTGGNAINIYYENGPKSKDIEKLTAKYKYGKFNSMQDIYEYTNKIEGIPQVKYLMINREMSHETEMELAKEIEKKYDIEGNMFNLDGTINNSCRVGAQWANDFIRRAFNENTYI